MIKPDLCSLYKERVTCTVPTFLELGLTPTLSCMWLSRSSTENWSSTENLEYSALYRSISRQCTQGLKFQTERCRNLLYQPLEGRRYDILNYWLLLWAAHWNLATQETLKFVIIRWRASFAGVEIWNWGKNNFYLKLQIFLKCFSPKPHWAVRSTAYKSCFTWWMLQPLWCTNMIWWNSRNYVSCKWIPNYNLHMYKPAN